MRSGAHTATLHTMQELQLQHVALWSSNATVDGTYFNIAKLLVCICFLPR